MAIEWHQRAAEEEESDARAEQNESPASEKSRETVPIFLVKSFPN